MGRDPVALIGRDAIALTVAPARCKANGCPCCGPRIMRRNRKMANLGLGEAGRAAIITGTLDPRSDAYRRFVAFSPAADRFSTRRVKSGDRWTTIEGETAASVAFVGRAWNRFVTYARRLEGPWTCDCRRTICAVHRGRSGCEAAGIPPRSGGRGRPRLACRTQPALRHQRGCTDRNRPFADLAYFKGLELQRNGRAHVHALVRLPDLATMLAMQARLRETAVACGFGGHGRYWRDGKGRLRHGFEIERIRDRQAAAEYVTKVAGSGFAAAAGEVAKLDQARRLPHRARRATWSLGRRRWSRAWAPARGSSGLAWSFAMASAETVTRALLASGQSVVAGSREPSERASRLPQVPEGKAS